MNVLKSFEARRFFSKGYDSKAWFFLLLYVFRIKLNVLLFNNIVKQVCKIKGVKLGSNLVFNGFPIINRFPDSNIFFGDKCKFNSSKKSVIINLNRRCSFSTLSKGAEIIIGENTGLTGTTIAADYKVCIGNNVLIGAYCTIIDNDFHDPNPAKRNKYVFGKKPVIIEDNVFIGMNCIIQKGVIIGKNSVIGAHSVVVTSIPPNSIAMGNPCKVILKRKWNI